MDTNNLCESGEADYRYFVARILAAIAVTAHLMGLRVGAMALVGSGNTTDLASDLIDGIGASVEAENTISAVPTALLSKYAVILAVANAAGEDWEYDYMLYQIAKWVIAKSFARTPQPKTRAGKTAFQALQSDWLFCVREDAAVLLADIDVEVRIVATALAESGSLTSEEMDKLLALVCVAGPAV
jgi:hypothetical protein